MAKITLIGLCLFCLLVYFNSLNNHFVFDDKALIVDNPFAKSTKLLHQIFKRGIYDHWIGLTRYDRMYRPLQILSYWLDYKIWGLNPIGFHLTNVLLHLFNSILIYHLLSLTFNNNKISTIAGILFLIHPIHTSVVSYIAARADLLSSLFMLLSIIGVLQFLKLKSKIYYISSLLFAVLALLSRENALVLFLFIALILFIQKVKIKDYLFVIPFIILDLFYLILRFFIFGLSGLFTHPAFFSFPIQVLNFFNIILKYIVLLVLPFKLHLLRVTPFIKGLLDVKTFFALIFISLYIFILVKLRKDKLLVFSMNWFFLGLIPVFLYLDGYPLLGGAMMSENWVYLPSIGFFIILASILNSFKKLGSLATLAFVIFYGALTVINNMHWKNDLVLHKRILQYTPESNPIRKDLIDDYLVAGLYDEALSEIKKFEIYYPGSPLLNIVWGNFYFFTQRPDLAIERYNQSINFNKHFFIYYRLSSCYRKIKETDKAIESSLMSFKINPYFEPNLIQLGDLYAQKQQFVKARKYYQMAYDLNPHNKVLRGLVKNAK